MRASAALAVITIMGSDVFDPIDLMQKALSSAFISPMELRADEPAVDYGYGEGLISFFRKCTKKEPGDVNPHPVIMAMEDEHPLAHKRIDAIEKNENYRE